MNIIDINLTLIELIVLPVVVTIFILAIYFFLSKPAKPYATPLRKTNTFISPM